MYNTFKSLILILASLVSVLVLFIGLYIAYSSSITHAPFHFALGIAILCLLQFFFLAGIKQIVNKIIRTNRMNDELLVQKLARRW